MLLLEDFCLNYFKKFKEKYRSLIKISHARRKEDHIKLKIKSWVFIGTQALRKEFGTNVIQGSDEEVAKNCVFRGEISFFLAEPELILFCNLRLCLCIQNLDTISLGEMYLFS